MRGATAGGANAPPILFCISTHAPLAGRDARVLQILRAAHEFQPTRPLRGATQSPQEDLQPKKFQPTRPLRGATSDDFQRLQNSMISTHAPLAGRDYHMVTLFAADPISTHAPLAGRDFSDDSFAIKVCISTHAPLAGRDDFPMIVSQSKFAFQPTRPLRGATLLIGSRIRQMKNFNPRAPCGARPQEGGSAVATGMISTHAPLAGRDSKSVQITMHIFAITDKFQMLLHRMPPVRAFCSFLMQENHADFGCEPPK